MEKIVMRLRRLLIDTLLVIGFFGLISSICILVMKGSSNIQMIAFVESALRQNEGSFRNRFFKVLLYFIIQNATLVFLFSFILLSSVFMCLFRKNHNYNSRISDSPFCEKHGKISSDAVAEISTKNDWQKYMDDGCGSNEQQVYAELEKMPERFYESNASLDENLKKEDISRSRSGSILVYRTVREESSNESKNFNNTEHDAGLLTDDYIVQDDCESQRVTGENLAFNEFGCIKTDSESKTCIRNASEEYYDLSRFLPNEDHTIKIKSTIGKHNI